MHSNLPWPPPLTTRARNTACHRKCHHRTWHPQLSDNPWCNLQGRTTTTTLAALLKTSSKYLRTWITATYAVVTSRRTTTAKTAGAGRRAAITNSTPPTATWWEDREVGCTRTYCPAHRESNAQVSSASKNAHFTITRATATSKTMATSSNAMGTSNNHNSGKGLIPVTSPSILDPEWEDGQHMKDFLVGYFGTLLQGAESHSELLGGRMVPSK